MTRATQWARLAQTAVYDLAVIGGGATGLGVALDAVLRGFSVVLFESHDFGGGTSSRSTKLLHGGVRYLAQGNIALVREALAERANVLRIAPHLAQPLPFVMPSYRWWQTPFYGIGLKLYDLLAGRVGLGHTEWLSAQETEAALPGIRATGLQGGVKYWDGQFDDARLALTLARTIERAGGLPLNHAEVGDVLPIAQTAGDDARFSLTVRDCRLGAEACVKARAVVNATGVWVDAVRQQALGHGSGAAPQRLVSPSQGVHVVVDRSFLPGDHALLVPKTDDGRVLFAVPWMGSLILGTTDTPREDLPREPQPFEAELDFILREAGKVLSRPVRRDDIRSVWVGLRPLVAASGSASGNAGSTKSLSREHTIVTDDNGLITVTGGKWTTYRSMAEDVLGACFDAGMLPRRSGGASKGHALVGAPTGGGNVAILRPPGEHLYGAEWPRVQACPGSGRQLGLGLTEAMVRFAVRHEYAATVEDVLARRWRALFLDARQAMAMAPEVAAIVHDETGEDAQLEAFLSLAQGYLPGQP
jgi:glycerol-3-phosphate dehydrogenase